jgi:CelD/BcsL family acetyltransferase involved in cellulose biosynthesis
LRVREVDDFSCLEEEWSSLLKSNVLGDNVFLTLDWLSTWWKHFGHGRRLLLLTVEDGNDVIAIAPLTLSKYKLPFFGSIRKVEFLGVGGSDYNNFIIVDKESECLRLIANYLVRNVDGWDWVELREIPENSENPSYVESLFSGLSFSSNLKLRRRVCNLCPYISLPESFEVFIKRLSKNLRQNLNKYLRRIRKEHGVELKRYDETGFGVREAMNIFVRLHGKRWASKCLPGAFRDLVFLNFHLDVAECFDRNGWLGLYFLMVDDKPVAAQYNFEYGGKMYYYLAGFDPEYSVYSVGNLLTMFILERCICRGFKEYDMMRGDEPYKLFWTDTCRRNFEIRLVRGGFSKEFYEWLTWNATINNLAGKLRLSLRRDYMQ